MSKKIILIKSTVQGSETASHDIATLFIDKLREQKLEKNAQAVRAQDLGVYGHGVVVKILPSNIVYADVTEGDIERIIEESVRQDNVIDDLLFKEKPKQLRVVLRNCGVIDPESIDAYLAVGGYQGFRRALFELETPERVIEEMKVSGLRGRGGAGYPTWLKWKYTRESAGSERFIICNADEGDPGAYMDRSILEGDPHSVIEGLMIAGFAIGAGKGFFYVRAEYPLAVERIEKAIRQAYDRGLLGEKILGSAFSFDVEIRLGAGAFVCGEETALIASIEGKRGTPRPRPPYPSVQGLWGKPTAINNVETLANVPVILSRSGKWFAGIGTQKSTGTKVFALTGKVKHSGLVEVPMGTTLREIVFDIGGGVLSSKGIKAVQTGGPSGGVIPKDSLDTPVDYENLQKLGSIMGSGGMIVMDEDDCMVDIAKFYLGFCVDESCGKCVPCRLGGYQMLGILNRICEGQGQPDDLANMTKIAQAMQKASLCGLGQTAANPVLSTTNYFPDEYKEHIAQKKCRAGKCVHLLTYSIVQEKCKRCGMCFVKCPVHAIGGDKQTGYYIQLDKCVKCGNCYEVCKFRSIYKG